jgi:uncharacterized protein YndB with AHSA1/START domain
MSKTIVSKDFQEKSILVSREFNAPLETVWKAFTESESLEKWWAPKPWRAETKTMHFSEGGYWLYAMVSPENEKHWGKMNFLKIDPMVSYAIEDEFCDEDGNTNTELPISLGKNTFTKTETGTSVEFKTTYNSEEEIHKLIEMGFEQGITMTFEELATLLENVKI